MSLTSSIYSYFFGGYNRDEEGEAANGDGGRTDNTSQPNQVYNVDDNQQEVSEVTALLTNNNINIHSVKTGESTAPGSSSSSSPSPPSLQEFFFPVDNPSIQRYYRFTVTPLAPIAALHKRPLSQDYYYNNSSHAAAANSGVTGLLRRSAVVPSHGTDASGQWILGRWQETREKE
jgi:hypothetical protein